MDKFSELIANGVAQFNYTPTNTALPEQCPVCREYNNIYSIATDTHMSHLEDGRKVITGHLVGIKSEFDRFICSGIYKNVDFRIGSPCSFFAKYGLCGHYDVLNGDNVYILDKCENAQCPCVTPNSTVASVFNGIPQNVRFIAANADYSHVHECMTENPVKSLNESKYISGNNWILVGLSDGNHYVETTRGLIIK